MYDFSYVISFPITGFTFSKHLSTCFSYKVPGYADNVDYMSFCTDIESVFTVKEMEKAPLLVVEPFRPPDDWSQNQLPKDYEGYAKNALNKLAERVIMPFVSACLIYLIIMKH